MLRKRLKRHLAIRAMKAHRQVNIGRFPVPQSKESYVVKPGSRPTITRRKVPKMVGPEVAKNIQVDVPSRIVPPAPAPEAKHPEKQYDVRPKDGLPTIYLDIERGNRMMIKWPDDIEGLTTNLTYQEDNEVNTIMGRIEDLTAQGAKKKLSPLNYFNACKVLNLLKVYNKQTDHKGRNLYSILISTAFDDWFGAEKQANELIKDAHKLLTYDAATVQTVFPNLKKPLYPWQTPAFQFIDAVTRDGRGVFLCDETGLGKTYTGAAHLVSMGYKAVVVCPAGLRHLWKRKIEDISHLTCLVVDSNYPIHAEKFDVIIVSYGMLKKRGIWPLSDIIDHQQRVLILDEGHAVKNYDSNRTNISLKLAQYARHSLVVTATPLKNRVGELHPLLRITRRLWTEMTFEAFVKSYSTPERQEEIAEHLQGFMVRRMADEVWKDAPQVEVGEAWLPLTNRGDYVEAEQDFIAWLMRHGADMDRLAAAERGHALVKLNKLRELAAVGKIEPASHIIEQTMNHGEQVVAFCAFNEPLVELATRFRYKTGTNYKGQKWQGSGLIIGSVPEKARNELIGRFMDGKIGILCVGTQAGGLGIDLPIAAYGYFLDLPWTPADFEQCTGRLKRLGQDRDCQFIKLLANGTIDQRMEQIIQDKALTFQRAIGDEDIVGRVTARDPASLRETIVSSLIRSYLRDAS